jgi:hypothetical protein
MSITVCWDIPIMYTTLIKSIVDKIFIHWDTQNIQYPAD